MRRRLWIIDLTLLALVVLTASMLRDRWQQFRTREEALLRQTVQTPPPPDVPALPAVTQTVASNYVDVAQQLLLSRDRNSTVILDPPPAPPPPKPMPPLPAAHGVIDLGSGPTVILSERPGARHHGYRLGEKVGEFKLISANRHEIVFEWDGKLVKKKFDDLLDKTPRSTEPKRAPQTTSAAKSAAPTNLTPVKAGPGPALSEKSRACVPNDTTPVGTVQDGFRKVVTKTPFGDSCRWEAVN